MKPNVTLDIAKDFSAAPAGRYRTDGDFSGEAFREDFLVPALNEADEIVVLMDGTEGYGSSFLDEAFGGLVRQHGITEESFHRRIHLISEDDPSFRDEVLAYVRDEDRRQAANREGA